MSNVIFLSHTIYRSVVTDNDGRTFALPSFGALHGAIVSNLPVTGRLANKIVDALYQAMLKLSM